MSKEAVAQDDPQSARAPPVSVATMAAAMNMAAPCGDDGKKQTFAEYMLAVSVEGQQHYVVVPAQHQLMSQSGGVTATALPSPSLVAARRAGGPWVASPIADDYEEAPIADGLSGPTTTIDYNHPLGSVFTPMPTWTSPNEPTQDKAVMTGRARWSGLPPTAALVAAAEKEAHALVASFGTDQRHEAADKEAHALVASCGTDQRQASISTIPTTSIEDQVAELVGEHREAEQAAKRARGDDSPAEDEPWASATTPFPGLPDPPRSTSLYAQRSTELINALGLDRATGPVARPEESQEDGPPGVGSPSRLEALKAKLAEATLIAEDAEKAAEAAKAQVKRR